MKFKKAMILLFAAACVMVCAAWKTPETVEEARYGDAPMISTYASESVYYSRKVIDAQNETPGAAPKYNPQSDLPNSCGATGGANILGYYDKYFPELIPNFQSHFPATGKYRMADSVYIPALMQDLYTRMRTNVTGDGVTEADFKNGLKAYAAQRGYAVNYQSVLSGSSFNFTAFKNAIADGKVVALFANPGDIYKITPASGYDIISSVNVTENHIMVAYGYQQISYYDGSGRLMRTDTYLKVSTGKVAAISALYKINPHYLNEACIVTVN